MDPMFKKKFYAKRIIDTPNDPEHMFPNGSSLCYNIFYFVIKLKQCEIRTNIIGPILFQNRSDDAGVSVVLLNEGDTYCPKLVVLK